MKCTIGDCNQPQCARKMCQKHYARWRRHGDPLKVVVLSGASHGSWKGDAASYKGVHTRLTKERGSARNHTCFECREQPATEWAYDHTDPNERMGTDGPYSVDLNRYEPLCVPCHRNSDSKLQRKEVIRRG